jgi:hypothetical protein
MKWSKEINFMLALAVEHQMTISTNGKSQTNWKAVLEIANDIFQHIPSFSQKFPQGLSDHHKLRSQWNDRTRARKNDLTKHRHTAWVLHQDLCTDAEIQRMTPLADTVINAFTERGRNETMLDKGTLSKETLYMLTLLVHFD